MRDQIKLVFLMASHEIYVFEADYTWKLFEVAHLMEKCTFQKCPTLNTRSLWFLGSPCNTSTLRRARQII